MGTTGWGLVVEIDSAGVDDLAVKSWKKGLTALGPILQPVSDIVPLRDGLELYYSAVVTPGVLPKQYARGLDNRPINVVPYAIDHKHLAIRIALPMNMDIRTELRFPGQLGAAREAGEFIHTIVNSIWFLDGDIIVADKGVSAERLIIDANSLTLHYVDFMGVVPSPALSEFINKLARLLLPKLMASQSFDVSPTYGALRGVGMANPSVDIDARTFDANSHEVTGSLEGDARFDFSLRTITNIGVAFGYSGHKAPEPGALPFRLLLQRDQTVALTVTQWALTFFEGYVVPKIINDAVKAKIGNASHRGLMAIDTEHGGQITSSDDDGVMVLTRVYDLQWDGQYFWVKADLYIIQRGLFGLDDLAPDIDVLAKVRFGIKPNDVPGSDGTIDYSKPLLSDVKLFLFRDESLWDDLISPFVAMEHFINGMGDILSGRWTDALIQGVEILADVPFLLMFAGFLVALFGGISLGDEGIIPSLKFNVGDDVLLLVKMPPADFPNDAPFNGPTLYMTIG